MSSLLEVDRRQITQGRMAATWVVAAFDPGEDRQAGFDLGLEATPVDQLALQAGKEALSIALS